MKSSLPILPNLIRKKGFTHPFLLTKKHRGTKRAGFTLIEMLVVSVIMVILMGSLAMIFLTANKSWTQSEAKLQIYQNAREALNRMSREIACAFQPSDPTMEKLNLTNNGYNGKDILEFTAAINNPNVPGEYDLSHLGYRWETDNTLERYKLDYGGGAGSWSPMTERITNLSIECHDGSSWVTSWSSNDLPKAIKVTIEAQDKHARYEPQTFESIIYIPTN